MPLATAALISPTTPTSESLRVHFPGLASQTVFLDNAGGSQVPIHVIDAARDYFVHRCAQTGAAYEASRAAAATVAAAHTVVKTFLNGHGSGEVALAQSTSSLVHILANAYADALHNGGVRRRRVIVSTLGHEANIWPWVRLAARGFEVVPWQPMRSGNLWTLDHDALDGLLDERTLLVAFPHVSNIMGQIEDAGAVCRRAGSVGARSVVDGVAFAPHRAPDVAALGCDWYLYSTYKVFGPHAAAAFGGHAAFAELDGPNHYFLPRTSVPYVYELGGVPHESAAAIGAFDRYLHAVTGEDPDGETTLPTSRATYVRAFKAFELIEEGLQTRLLDGLKQTAGVVIAGSAEGGRDRVCTVSFYVPGTSSAGVAAALNAAEIGVKAGNFYSRRLIQRMGLDPADGVVRISLAHYNTIQEVETVLNALRRHLRGVSERG